MGLCKDNFELTKSLCYLAKIYGPKVMMHSGDRHDYLGMDMHFPKGGVLNVSMVMYLRNMINLFPEEITGNVSTPAADHLFNVRGEGEARLLEEERALAFHHTVAQLIFMLTRARQDIQIVEVFLTTQVKMPDKDDWGKLKQVLQCVNGTKHLKLKLSVGDLEILKWYVDRLHNVHLDCKGNRGAMFTMGMGLTSSSPRKIKLNTKPSTKKELLAADMYMPKMLWTLNFIRAQGYKTECVGLYQDNISSQLMIKNRKLTSGKKQKTHKDKVLFYQRQNRQRRDKIDQLSRKRDVSRHPNKPLQGMAFRKMRAVLMNCPVNYEENDKFAEKPANSNNLKPGTGMNTTNKQLVSTSPQECVGHKRIQTAVMGKWVGVAHNVTAEWQGGRQVTE
jgi:hypothetical protein